MFLFCLRAINPRHFHKGLSDFFTGRDTYTFFIRSSHFVPSSPHLILCMRRLHFISLLEDFPSHPSHFLFNLSRLHSSALVQPLSWIIFIELLGKLQCLLTEHLLFCFLLCFGIIHPKEIYL